MKSYEISSHKKYMTDTSALKFHSFPDLEENVKNQVDRIKSTPSLPKNTAVYGFIYDIRQENLEELSEIYKTKKD